jgi:hypothetical protein
LTEAGQNTFSVLNLGRNDDTDQISDSMTEKAMNLMAEQSSSILFGNKTHQSTANCIVLVEAARHRDAAPRQVCGPI